MTPRIVLGLSLILSSVPATGFGAAPDSPVTLKLWTGTAPGDKGNIGEEHNTSKPGDNQVAGRPVIRIGNVTEPSITLYRPPTHLSTGAGVLVCPGGGYNILAWDLEGTEVCEWLNTLGVTGILLKYRVPKRDGLEKHVPAFQDAQRALRLIRHRAAEFGLDPQRLGVLGFSAGGHLAAVLSNQNNPESYPPADAADSVSSRPNFSVLIYPAYLTPKEQEDQIVPELPVSSNTPPTFISISADDPVRVEGPLFYTLGLKKAGVPVELHVYPSGGHGYGLRRTANPVTTWPDRVGEWLHSQGLLHAPGKR
jgi:acetyl esterase/lipase